MHKNRLPPSQELDFNNVTANDGNLGSARLAFKTVPANLEVYFLPPGFDEVQKTIERAPQKGADPFLPTLLVSYLPPGHAAETKAEEVKGRKKCLAKNGGKASETDESTIKKLRAVVECNHHQYPKMSPDSNGAWEEF